MKIIDNVKFVIKRGIIRCYVGNNRKAMKFKNGFIKFLQPTGLVTD